VPEGRFRVDTQRQLLLPLRHEVNVDERQLEGLPAAGGLEQGWDYLRSGAHRLSTSPKPRTTSTTESRTGRLPWATSMRVSASCAEVAAEGRASARSGRAG